MTRSTSSLARPPEPALLGGFEPRGGLFDGLAQASRIEPELGADLEDVGGRYAGLDDRSALAFLQLGGSAQNRADLLFAQSRFVGHRCGEYGITVSSIHLPMASVE